jgi:hypothetical protein
MTQSGRACDGALRTDRARRQLTLCAALFQLNNSLVKCRVDLLGLVGLVGRTDTGFVGGDKLLRRCRQSSFQLLNSEFQLLGDFDSGIDSEESS